MVHYTRRSVLAATAGLATASLAGCLDGATAGRSGDADTMASFAVLADLSAAVGGETLAVEGVVPFGQHGHGWQPSAAVQRSIRDASAFVYAGTGFQPWADDVVTSLDADGADVHVVDARRDVDLLPTPSGEDEGDHEGTTTDDHHEAHEGESTETAHEGDHDGTEPHETTHHEEDHDGETGHDGEDHAGHDHGAMDPHFWLDPTRTVTAVETVTEGLTTAFPDDEATLRENASAYVEELRALDAEFEETLAGRSRETVLVAGHDAFQYLGERYGFEIHALTGLSPDDSPTPRDVERAQTVVEDEGVTHVLAPVFESDRAARRLAEETAVEGVLPITALAGRTEEWADQGWRYEDVMREVNLATLREALGA
ncbi:metal ABC transporter substrate-binding protein [Halomarina oriensis]|uniref:Zinc ABC transporter solute-binding protein n=1 Tax=Halomarina oriensis TaxID=671145 RepID=A0A6B0GE54_9EURY|nr:zinc ABC transporter substrate-binding protein [Halomarina oriensis]MWG33092.1 zinc ABC transporter solute-binding protein [Halomarina oriensis]